MVLFNALIGAIASQAGSSGDNPLPVIVGLLNRMGGLPGLLQKLQQAGLGDEVKSWISTGANQPVSPDALGQALGADTVANFARQLGIDPQQGLGMLAQVLPQVVDGLSPQGRLPAEGSDLGVLLGGLMAGAGGPGSLPGMLGGLLGKR
jgi:uncharacterized protein YidB (DUF937 family)